MSDDLKLLCEELKSIFVFFLVSELQFVFEESIKPKTDKHCFMCFCFNFQPLFSPSILCLTPGVNSIKLRFSSFPNFHCSLCSITEWCNYYKTAKLNSKENRKKWRIKFGRIDSIKKPKFQQSYNMLNRLRHQIFNIHSIEILSIEIYGTFYNTFTPLQPYCLIRSIKPNS